MMESTKTADEVIASVDATLAIWRSAFEASPPKKTSVVNRVDGGGGGASSSSSSSSSLSPEPINDESEPLLPPWKDSEAYHRRLSTFKPTTYFAKPLALSPLACAAFGWENTGKDIIKCQNCGATICIAFHPSLNEESRDKLCEIYMGMLVSSHAASCSFRTFASRCSKVMQKSSRPNRDDGCEKAKKTEILKREDNHSESLMNKVSNALSDSKNDFYVPPYLLSFSDKFLRFEDRTSNGSITNDCVKEGALQIREKLKARIDEDSEISVTVPCCVTDFCDEVDPDSDVDKALYLKNSTMKVPYLLSVFGWSLCNESVGDKSSVIVECSICQAKACMAISWCTDERSARKRPRIDTRGDANIKLIGSHRVYCPYVSGFSFGPRKQSDLPGWKLVISNLLKSAPSTPVADC